LEKIIVPVDFSEYSEFALKAAALLSKKVPVEIYALHMLDLQEVNMSQTSSYSQEKGIYFLKLAEQKFKKFLQKDFLKEAKVVPVIKHYKVFSEVNAIAKEINADLIIMGSHGASGLKEFFTGSNTEKVIRYSEVPVLILKKELKDIDFSEIVFATDFSKETIPAYNRMLASLEFLGAKMHLLFVNLPNEKFKTTPEMDTLANNFLMSAEGNVDRLINVNFVCAKTVEDGILSFSNLVGADLIALVTHGRKGLAHVFSGSISEDISNHSALPIMTFKI
jgi:nucleotide-binding universal stress UspA family protein|tara:strand:- start:6854 stop:7687 length:834 start_codon:yes stop_codon:yes gene_type:complete